MESNLGVEEGVGNKDLKKKLEYLTKALELYFVEEKDQKWLLLMV